MSELRYDEELPFAVLEGQYVVARFPYKNLAEEFVSKMGHEYNVIVDTTPKPKIPEDAEFITWRLSEGDSVHVACIEDTYWVYGNSEVSHAELLEEIGDAKVTVLVRKESE